MERDIVYWASASSHEDFVDACIGMAARLTKSGFPVETRKTARATTFFAERIGEFEIDKADIYGVLKPTREFALAALLIFGVAVIRPEVVLIATEKGGRPPIAAADSSRFSSE